MAPRLESTRARPRADERALDELAARLEQTPRGVVVAGRQPDLGLAGPVAELAAATGYPILAEPPSQLRRGPPDRSLVVTAYDAIVWERPQEVAPELIIRFG